jgi:membrane protease YdiL (CAAX protease family)
MKRGLRVASSIAFLLVMYYLLQMLFLTITTRLAVMAGTNAGILPAGTMGLVNDAAFVKENLAVETCLVNAQALGIFLSTVTMLLFVHLTGAYRLRLGLLRSIALRPLLISTLLVFSSMFALNIFVQWFPLKDNMSDVFSGLSRNVLGIFSLALLAPLLEEVLFRGAIQGVLMHYFGRPWPAIIVSALVFGIFHLNPVQIVYATLLGIVLGWIYYRTRSLLSVIVGHVLNNSLAVATTVFYGAAEEQAVANSTAGIVGFVLFATLSIYLAVKLNKEMQEKLKGEI